jgi:AraC-like DNA-binding protein
MAHCFSPLSASTSPGPVLRRFSGARSIRVIDPSHAEVAEHAHDWPVLSLYVMGAYRNRSALGEIELNAPSVAFYAAGAAHANGAGPDGFEQIEVEFDPAWLGGDVTWPAIPVCRRVGPAGAAARTLARLWSSPSASEDALRTATGDLIRSAFAGSQARRPAWIDHVARRVSEAPGVRLGVLAAETRLHPSWLGQAYRVATGETVRQTATRRRTEVAARLLRETETPSAEVALEAGFCDQSHMIRAFRRALGRTPAEVRADRDGFRTLKTSNP